jgi:hypothetical protein
MNETKSLNPVMEEAATEAAVLRLLLVLHPTQLTLPELVREISGDRSDFAATDPVDRAIIRLSAGDLLNHNGDAVRSVSEAPRARRGRENARSRRSSPAATPRGRCAHWGRRPW